MLPLASLLTLLPTKVKIKIKPLYLLCNDKRVIFAIQITTTMSQANISIRVDKTIKDRFCSLCDAFGLTTTSAFNLFMKAVIRERKIPFEISADEKEETKVKGARAFQALREQAARNGIQDLTLEEINAEIKAARNERRNKSK